MNQDRNSKKKIDRRKWKTARELREEFGYGSNSTVRDMVSDFQIPNIKHRGAMYVDRDFFIKLPRVMERMMDSPEMEKYNQQLELEGDWIITGDVHIPCQDTELELKLMEIAKHFKVKRLIIAGDLMEQDAFKHFTGERVSWKYEKKQIINNLLALSTWFDTIVLLIGNHELRMWKRLEARIEQDDIFESLVTQDTLDKIKYSSYPYAIINKSWFIVHPKAYSRIQARAGYFLASKHMVALIEKNKGPNNQYGIITFHGHLGGEGTDISGRFQVADGMGLMDPSKVEYKSMKITNHPEWRPGFFMLLDNYLYRFPKNTTNWEFWLKKKVTT